MRSCRLTHVICVFIPALLLQVVLFGACSRMTSETCSVTLLRCELQTNPIGIDTPQPRFSWVLESKERGEQQIAYEILVASSGELLSRTNGDCWSSGRVNSSQSVHVSYGGKLLEPSMFYFWKVRVWDKNGTVSEWSPPSRFVTGILSSGWGESRWLRASETLRADTVVASPWFRKSFELKGTPKQALLHVASRGYHELWVNGQKADSSVLSPAVSILAKRSLYITYDIARLLKKGQNTIGLWLGRGWHVKGYPRITDNRPLVRVKGVVRNDEGETEIHSDGSWQCAQSPFSAVGPWQWGNFGGEQYDARLENNDWSVPGSGDSGWMAAEGAPEQGERIETQTAPLNRIGKILPAVSCSERTKEGYYILDFGTDLTGWLKFQVPQLHPGQKVVFRYYDSGGNFFNQMDEFISAGRPDEVWTSKFNYRGFRTVAVEGLASKPDLKDAVAMLVESDLEVAGSFACSDTLLNRIHELNMWTLRCLNLGGYLVDCPHRERLGYGDGQVSVESAVMNMWMPAFYRKWLTDWIDVQDTVTGALPFATQSQPGEGQLSGEFGREGPPGWGGALPAIAWRTYLYYGDTALLERFYTPMKRFAERIEHHAAGGILRGYGDEWQRLGDWVPPDRGMDTKNWPAEIPNNLFNNCYRIYLLDIVRKSADVLGKREDAQWASGVIETLRPLIHSEFYKKEKGYYTIDEQAYQVMPLFTGVVPEKLRPAVMNKLEELIRVKRKGHLDTGMLGTYFLLEYLSEADRDDLVYTIMSAVDYPGWGYMLSQGATTMWEQWNGYWSRIHSCFTSPAGWMHYGLAGIRPGSPGFKNIIIRPATVGTLTWVKASHVTPYGEIKSAWRNEKGRFTLDLTIPGNTSAIVYLPARSSSTLMESGLPLEKAAGVKFLRMEKEKAVIEVGAGTYEFESAAPGETVEIKGG